MLVCKYKYEYEYEYRVSQKKRYPKLIKLRYAQKLLSFIFNIQIANLLLIKNLLSKKDFVVCLTASTFFHCPLGNSITSLVSFF